MTINPLLTLRMIKAPPERPCEKGWLKGLRALGPDIDAPISLGDIALSNGAEDAIWCLRKLDWSDVAIRRAVIGEAILPACRRAQVHTTDPRAAACNDVLARWCAGDESVDLKGAAAAAAYTAAAAAAAAASAAAAACAAAAVGDDANAAAYAASYAACAPYATVATQTTERQRQRADIIAAFPPVRLARKESE